MKIKEPKLQTILENKTTYENDELCYGMYQDVFIEQIKTPHFKINECHFKNTDFFECEWEYIDGMDIIFENCDLSNIIMSDGSLHRIIFKNCKLIGCDFSGSSIHDLQMYECNAAYSNFSFGNIKNMIAQQCDFTQSSFNETKLKNIQINECNFIKTEFIHTPLKDIDFSNSNIEGIHISTDSLYGIIVNPYQAMDLAKLLGIIIKEGL